MGPASRLIVGPPAIPLPPVTPPPFPAAAPTHPARSSRLQRAARFLTGYSRRDPDVPALLSPPVDSSVPSSCLASVQPGGHADRQHAYRRGCKEAFYDRRVASGHASLE